MATDLGPTTVLYDEAANPPPARTPGSPLLPAAIFTLLPARPGPIESMARFHDVEFTRSIFTTTEADRLPPTVAPILVLAGQRPLQHFLPHASIDIATGRPFVRGGRIFLPVVHPTDKPGWAVQGEIGWAMATLYNLQHGRPIVDHVGPRCWMGGCGRWAKAWDVEAVPWCEVHWERRKLSPTERRWERERLAGKVVAKAKARVRARRQGVLHG